MKPGDRVILSHFCSPTYEDTVCTLGALPTKNDPGLIIFDGPWGHDADVPQRGVSALISDLCGQGNVFDKDLIISAVPPNSHRRLWWISDTKEIRFVSERTLITRPSDPLAHVPGKHQCAGGCGDINEHATARSFVGGKYVCYSCRNVWNPKAC